MKFSKDFMKFYVIPLVLFIGLLLTAVFTVFYTITTKTTEGKTISSRWPMEFTLSFEQYISGNAEGVSVTEKGRALLQQNGLWLQILDEEGNEVLNYARPTEVPDTYKPYELVELYQYGMQDYSVFMSSKDGALASYTYLIAFPLSLSKVVMYVDNGRYTSGKTLVLIVILSTFVLLLALTVIFNMLVCRNLDRIRFSLQAVAARKYKADRNPQFLREIYDGIDRLNQDIMKADRQRELDDKAKEEWLANITHDLNTPLAPIRGYAELLTDDGAVPDSEVVQHYGKIMLKNAIYAQSLVDDLKLTYQLQSDMLPMAFEKHDLVRFVRELIIDILNSPDYDGHEVIFDCDQQRLEYHFDERLLRRALSNIIINALKHNDPITRVTVSIISGDTISLRVADNGNGMSAQELAGLFTRYYRGTNTENKSEGSGLGMAIARQIIEAHGGSILAESEPGVGCEVRISFPLAGK